MLTIFTIPKPFKGHINIIQRNAIESWLLLEPKCQIVLFGNDDGVAQIAKEYGVLHIQEVIKNKFGTPLLNDVFTKAGDLAKFDHLCYVNSDIMLLDDFMEAFKQIENMHFEKFLAIGKRWDIDLTKLIDFKDKKDVNLLKKLKFAGNLHGHSGIDYFLFKKGMFNNIPPFAVGRSGWDNWMVYNACHNNIPVIDFTKVSTVLHQNHDYSHMANGMCERDTGQEANMNFQYSGSYKNFFTIRDATYKLEQDGLEKNKDHLYKVYRWLLSNSRFSEIMLPFIKRLRKIREKFQ